MGYSLQGDMRVAALRGAGGDDATGPETSHTEYNYSCRRAWSERAVCVVRAGRSCVELRACPCARQRPLTGDPTRRDATRHTSRRRIAGVLPLFGRLKNTEYYKSIIKRQERTRPLHFYRFFLLFVGTCLPFWKNALRKMS